MEDPSNPNPYPDRTVAQLARDLRNGKIPLNKVAEVRAFLLRHLLKV